MVPEIYKCVKCGNVYEKTLTAGGCTPKCCGESAVLLEAQTAVPEENKHVPFIVRQDGGILVKVGKTAAHPMEPEHYIVWIQLEVNGISLRKFLKPGDAPEAFFPVDGENAVAFELCNKHNLWKSQ